MKKKIVDSILSCQSFIQLSLILESILVYLIQSTSVRSDNLIYFYIKKSQFNKGKINLVSQFIFNFEFNFNNLILKFDLLFYKII